ncbi:MAG: replication initiation protein [Sarcina sp.]
MEETSLDILFKNNKMIKAKYDFTLAQNRVMQKAFHYMQKNNSQYAYFTLDDMKEITGHRNNQCIPGIKLMLDELMKNRVIQIKDNGSWISSYIIASHGFDKESNTFTISLAPMFVDMILEYREHGFAPLNVTRYLEIGGSNAQRLYEFLRMWTGTKHIIEYKVEELREYLNLTEAYKEFNDFKRRVIEASVKEINKKELMNIHNVEYIKVGRKVERIKFYVKDLEPRNYDFGNRAKVDSDGNIPLNGQIEIEDYQISSQSDNEILADKAKLSVKTINRLIKESGIEKVTKAIDILLDAQNVKAPLKYLKGIIENLSKEKTSTTTSSNKTSKFSNYDQRSYDHKKVEDELMGWD